MPPQHHTSALRTAGTRPASFGWGAQHTQREATILWVWRWVENFAPAALRIGAIIRSAVRMQGFLHKQSSAATDQVPRWFVLEPAGRRLSYYLQKFDAAPRRQIDIGGSQIESGSNPARSGRHTLTIRADGRVYGLEAESLELRDKWVVALREVAASAACKPGPPSSPSLEASSNARAAERSKPSPSTPWSSGPAGSSQEEGSDSLAECSSSLAERSDAHAASRERSKTGPRRVAFQSLRPKAAPPTPPVDAAAAVLEEALADLSALRAAPVAHEVFENARYNPSARTEMASGGSIPGAWGSAFPQCMLPHDPAAFTNRLHQRGSGRASVAEVGCPAGWEWTDEWSLDTAHAPCDVAGWMYGTDFTQLERLLSYGRLPPGVTDPLRPPRSSMLPVRWRRWVRHRRLVDGSARRELSELPPDSGGGGVALIEVRDRETLGKRDKFVDVVRGRGGAMHGATARRGFADGGGHVLLQVRLSFDSVLKGEAPPLSWHQLYGLSARAQDLGDESRLAALTAGIKGKGSQRRELRNHHAFYSSEWRGEPPRRRGDAGEMRGGRYILEASCCSRDPAAEQLASLRLEATLLTRQASCCSRSGSNGPSR